MNNEKAIQLEAPGAGVPFYDRILFKFVVAPLVAAKTPWETSTDRFHKVTQKILAEIDGLTEAQLTTRILVPPMKGLEDSSRYWSIAMALEHIVIVGSQMAQLIPALTNNIVPDAKADIAALKPLGKITGSESVQVFKKFARDEYALLNSSLSDKKSKTRFFHPWFGMMTAQQWYWLLSTHHYLHLQQIRAIKKRLPLI